MIKSITFKNKYGYPQTIVVDILEEEKLSIVSGSMMISHF
jgi:hypothetical protein